MTVQSMRFYLSLQKQDAGWIATDALTQLIFPSKYPMREIIGAIQDVQRAGGAWRLMPHNLPHWRTVYEYFRDWEKDGTGGASMTTSIRRFAEMKEARRTWFPRRSSSVLGV